MTVLVTGAKGFIGRNMVSYISHELKIPVAGLGHGSIEPSLMASLGLTEWINGDVDHANLQDLQNRCGGFECVFHLAGGSHVGRSFQNPSEDFHRTVVATNSLLDWIRMNCPDTKIVVASSAAVYGSGHDGPIAEDAQLHPYSPYGTHKKILESLARSYCENFGLSVGVCRLFSVYGAGLEKQLVFDLCSKCRTADGRIGLGGFGTELRDWIEVSDVTRLLWLVREKCSPECFVVNGGTGIATSVEKIANLVVQGWGNPLTIDFSGSVRQGDPISLVADSTKAAEIGFQPIVEVSEGIQRVMDWYRGTFE